MVIQPKQWPIAWTLTLMAIFAAKFEMGVSGRTKHFNMAIHFFRDCVQLLSVVPRHVLTKQQRADIFTKLLDKTTFLEQVKNFFASF